MAIGHCRVTTITRAKGHTVAAALAYRFGIALTCSRTGERADFRARTRRGEIADTGIEAARPTPIADSAKTFAAGLEAAERRGDSRLARDIQVALPCELDERARIELARTFTVALAERYWTLIAWAVHPGHNGDGRNHHAHLLMATRALDDAGELGAKLRQLDNPRTAGDEVAEIRNLWADLANQALERAGLEARVDVGQRLDAAPAPSLPGAVVGRERRGARRRKVRRKLREHVDAMPANADLDVDEIDELAVQEERAAARETAVAARTLIRDERANLVTDAATAVAGTTVEHTGPPRYERRARSRMSRWREARGQTPERQRRPRQGREPTTAPATTPPAPETPTPTPEPKRIRPAPPTPSPAPAPIPPHPGTPDLDELEAQLHRARTDRADVIADLEAIAAEAAIPPPEVVDPADLTEDERRSFGLSPAPAPTPAPLGINEALELAAQAERAERARRPHRPDGSIRRMVEAGRVMLRAAEARAAEAKADRHPEDTAMPPRIPAHADTHGRRPDRAPLRDAAEAERDRADHARRAGEDREQWELDSLGEAIGERWLIRHAGYVAPGDLWADIDESPDIDQALEPHVRPFALAPLAGHADEADPERRHHMGQLRHAIERWRHHWTHHRRTAAEPTRPAPDPAPGSGIPASQMRPGPPPRRPHRPPEPDQDR